MAVKMWLLLENVKFSLAGVENGSRFGSRRN